MGSLGISTPPEQTVEVIFLGTGTSSCVPQIACLTAPPGGKQCRTCLSTLTPEGKKNVRRNTSIAVRVSRGKDGNPVTIVVDVGKSFQASAVEWFPKYGLRRIDAVLITHAHADAMNGLDDLRAWTLGSAIQPYVDIYVSRATFKEIQRAFPYLVMKEFASGGGDVPEFKWHIIEDRKPFEIGETGVRIKPFAVHHGRTFATTGSGCACASTPDSSPASTSPPTPAMPGSPVQRDDLVSPKPPFTPERAQLPKGVQPYISFGFTINDCVTYLSDVSRIPEDVWGFLLQRQANGVRRNDGGPPVFIIDCLRPKPYSSHFGLGESLEAGRRLGACRTYLTGFGHAVSHDEYTAVCEAVGGKPIPVEEMTTREEKCFKFIKEGKPLWVRPAFDGLRVFVNGDGVAGDDAYD